MYTIEDNVGYQNYDYLNEIIDYTLKKLKINKGVFSIILINDQEMIKLNKQYRNIDQTTDVLSFRIDDDILGDIYISIPQMKKQAKAYGHTEERELSFLTLHGLLHLLGYDHQNEEAEKVMFKLQKEILDEKRV